MSNIGSEEEKEKENYWVKKRTYVRTVNGNRKQKWENEKYRIKQNEKSWVSKELLPPWNKEIGSEKWNAKHQYWTLKSEKESKYYLKPITL